MGMGFGAGFVFKLDKEKVEALVAERLATFLTVMGKYGGNYEDFAMETSYGWDCFRFNNIG